MSDPIKIDPRVELDEALAKIEEREALAHKYCLKLSAYAMILIGYFPIRKVDAIANALGFQLLPFAAIWIPAILAALFFLGRVAAKIEYDVHWAKRFQIMRAQARKLFELQTNPRQATDFPFKRHFGP